MTSYSLAATAIQDTANNGQFANGQLANGQFANGQFANGQSASDLCLVLGDPLPQQQQQLLPFWQRDTRRCGGLAVTFQISSI
jgi:hypothetical protein